MARISQTSQFNNHFMASAVLSKYAVWGLIASFTIVLAATGAAGLIKFGGIGWTDLISAQKSTPILWALDVLPLAVVFWGWHVRKKLASKKEQLLITPTEKESARVKSALEKTMRGVSHDPLTGLPNRVLFKDFLEYAMKIADRDKTSISVFVLDLDRFKEINNTLGHASGDLLIRAVAKRLSGVLRKSDRLARFGGDEFAILLRSVNGVKDLEVIADKITRALDPPFVLQKINLDVKASIGGVIYPDQGNDADTLLKRADIAMYLAKDNNERFVLYDPEMDKYSSYRLTLTGELKSAISLDDLTLYYQPKIDIEKNRLMGAEALVRWTHQDHGTIFPDEFISIAERTGLINPLFEWVANHAAEQAAKWHRSGQDLDVSINLSAANLVDPHLPEIIHALPGAYDIPADRITLEITETAIMSDPHLSLEVVTHISNMGFKFSIDDFGTGYSSFAYLAKLPIKEIKIDKSFVMEMLTNETNYIIVYTAIEMAHNLGLKVVAEGVENENVLRELGLMGCDIAQGHFINRPLSPDQFDAWVMSSKWGHAN